MLTKFSQVKLSSTDSSAIGLLFKTFNLNSALKKGKIIKQRGHSPFLIISILLIVILQRSHSIFSGLLSMFSEKLKTPVNDFLKDPDYNWRNFLYSIAKTFTIKCPAENGDGVLIADDTSKIKTGRKGEYFGWFRDHTKNAHYIGFQNITLVWSNLKTAIPIDFEMKIGRKKVKNAKFPKYDKNSHVEKRIRDAKKSKNDILIQMIKRAIQRGFKFKLILWDSWYTCTKTVSFVSERLIGNGYTLISMLKNNNTKYKHISRSGESFLCIRELKDKAGKWINDRESGIKYKSIIVDYLDTKSHKNIEKRKIICKVKITFFKYPNVRNSKAILSTDIELSEIDILNHYLKRWSIECLFKDLKEFFGYNSNQFSKYSTMVSDTTIKYAFYIMFCYKKQKANEVIEQDRKKTTAQILFDFYNELFDIWLYDFIQLMFKQMLKDLIELAISKGIHRLEDLRENLDNLMSDFFNGNHYIDKITEV